MVINAQRTALRGDIEAAMLELHRLWKSGHIAARASLAEIAAYRGHWNLVLEHSSAVVLCPVLTDSIEVYNEMITLIGLASLKLGCWAYTKAVALHLVGNAERLQLHNDQLRAAVGLMRFAVGKGNISLGWRPGGYNWCDERMCRTYYASAVRLYDRGDLPALFDAAIFLATGLAIAGRTVEAWDLVRFRLGSWIPIAETQIAPVELLTATALQQVLNPDRYEKILRTSRGGGSQTRVLIDRSWVSNELCDFGAPN